jgi:hypothetical protein
MISNLLINLPLLVKNRLGPYYITIKRDSDGAYRCPCCNGWTSIIGDFRKMEEWSANRIIQDLKERTAPSDRANIILKTQAGDIVLSEKDFK